MQGFGEGIVTFRKALLCVVIMLAGCMPVPSIPHGLGRVYDRKVIESFRPGEVTRIDILMTIGEPLYRFEEDRFFMYEWAVVYGWGLTFGGPFPIMTPHYFCLEFGPDSYLLRIEHLRGLLFGKPEGAIQKCTHMNQSKKTP